jgi:sister chromatid cohesion protein DCC1
VAAATGTDPAFAVLCTADKTFHLRQVQTSNSVFIVRPTPTTLTDDDDDDGFDGDGVGLCAIATCGATLELSVSKESAAPYLLELLAEWDGVSDHIPANMPIMDWPGVRDSIPLSASELRKEWVRMCVFQHGSTCLRPTPNCLLEAWRSILETSVAEDINLADQAHVSRLWDCFSVDGSTVPKALFQAIMTRQAVNPSGGDDDQTNALSALESALWTAKILLASNGREMPRQKFLDQWMELLPDKWQAEANLANIKVSSSAFYFCSI